MPLPTPIEIDALSFRHLDRPLRRSAAAAAGLVDSRRRDLPRPRFLRTLRPPPPPLLHFGRRFADGTLGLHHVAIFISHVYN